METTTHAIEHSLKSLRDLPVAIPHWQVETGSDWTEEPAIWVWGFLDDATIDADMQFTLRSAIRNVIRQHAGDDVTIYIRFRAASDLAESS